MTEIKEQILYFKKYLEKYTDKKPEEKKILHVIKKLKKLPITLEHLQETAIGKVVNSFRRHDGEIGPKVKDLIQQWKGLVPEDNEPCSTDDTVSSSRVSDSSPITLSSDSTKKRSDTVEGDSDHITDNDKAHKKSRTNSEHQSRYSSSNLHKSSSNLHKSHNISNKSHKEKSLDFHKSDDSDKKSHKDSSSKSHNLHKSCDSDKKSHKDPSKYSQVRQMTHDVSDKHGERTSVSNHGKVRSVDSNPSTEHLETINIDLTDSDSKHDINSRGLSSSKGIDHIQLEDNLKKKYSNLSSDSEHEKPSTLDSLTAKIEKFRKTMNGDFDIFEDTGKTQESVVESCDMELDAGGDSKPLEKPRMPTKSSLAKRVGFKTDKLSSGTILRQSNHIEDDIKRELKTQEGADVDFEDNGGVSFEDMLLGLDSSAVKKKSKTSDKSQKHHARENNSSCNSKESLKKKKVPTATLR